MKKNWKNTIKKSEYVFEYVFREGCYILATLQKFRPRNFDKEDEHRKNKDGNYTN